LERQRARYLAARALEIAADGAMYKGIRIVEAGNMVGDNADDPFTRDPRVLKKFQMIIDQLKFIRPSAMKHIQQCSHVVTMTLQTTEAAMSLQMKQNITLENTHMMRRCDILAASYRGYLSSFVKMIEFGIIVSNTDRLEFTDHNVSSNEIRAARVAFGELFYLKRETKTLFRKLFTECKRLINAVIAPLPSCASDDVCNVKAFTKSGISSRSLQKSIESIGNFTEVFHPVFDVIFKIMSQELDSRIRDEGKEGKIVMINTFRQGEGLDVEIIRGLDELDGEGFEEGEQEEDDARVRHGQVTIDLPGLRRPMNQNENPEPNRAQEPNQEKYGEISNWLVTSLLYTLNGSEAVSSPRERSRHLIQFYAVTRNIMWYNYILNRASGASLEVPSLFADYYTLYRGTFKAIRDDLEPGRETFGTVLQTIKRSTSKVVHAFVTKKIRAVMNELKLSCEISRITQLNVLNNLNLKDTVSHEDIRLSLENLRAMVLESLFKLMNKRSVRDILDPAPNNIEYWIHINGKPPNVSSVFKKNADYINQQVDSIINQDDFDFCTWFALHERMMISYLAMIQIAQGGQLFRGNELHGSFISPPTDHHDDGIQYVPQIRSLILVNTKMKSARMRNEIRFQGIFIRDTRLAVAVLSIAREVYLSLLARYHALEVRSPSRTIEEMIVETNKRLVSMTVSGSISSDRFRRLLKARMYEGLGLSGSNGSYQELRQLLVQLSSCLNVENVRERMQEINSRLVNNHQNRTEDMHYLQWTGVPTSLKLSTITVLYERYKQFQTLILHSREVIDSNRRAIDDAFNRFDDHNGERAGNNDGNHSMKNNRNDNNDGSDSGKNNRNDNRNNHDDSSSEENRSDSDSDNDHDGVMQDDAERGGEIDAIAGNVEAREEVEADDERFLSASEEEEMIHIYSDAETIETGSEEEQQRGLHESCSLDDIGSDDTTLIGSSQCSRKLSPQKRNMRYSSMLLTEEEYDGYKEYIGTSPCGKRTRGAKVEDEIECVIVVD
jgi:hypothetical protein